jgi:hypothetical protein
MQIFIRPNGAAQCVYADQLQPVLATIGATSVRRASHVEPDPDDNEKWFVDLSPVGGPVKHGFETRAAALDFEVDWLHREMSERHVSHQH